MASITLKGLSKRFHDVVAVDCVDLEIADGSFTVLLGPSGCGKSTTLNMIAGLEDPSSGQILFDGREMQFVPPHRRDIAMVFQSYALYPNRSVRQNIEFPLRLAGKGRAAIRDSVTAVANKLSITELLDRRPSALSGGQQQRVALARAMVRQPKAFLLDEPLSNLDAKLRVEMQFEIENLQKDLQATFIHVTHDQAEAMSLADKIVVMNSGTVRQTGTPEEIYQDPVELFVAQFVGTPRINLIEGRVEDGEFRAPGWVVSLAGSSRSGSTVLGVRPEGLRIADVGSPQADARGVVRTVDFVGADKIVAVETDAGIVRGRVAVSAAHRRGDHVGVSVELTSLLVFDHETGLRVRP